MSVFGPGPYETPPPPPPPQHFPVAPNAPLVPYVNHAHHVGYHGHHHGGHHGHHGHHHGHHAGHPAPHAPQPFNPVNLNHAFDDAADAEAFNTPVRPPPSTRMPRTPPTPPTVGVLKRYQSPSGGLNAVGRRYFESHGSHDLKSPAPHPHGPKGEARKHSFCARMEGNPGPMRDDHGDPTRKALALRKWAC